VGGKASGEDSYVALMRGLNVGGNNRLPMVDLVAIFEEAGCKEVRTYIQSGNVLFQASSRLATKLPTIIEQAIQKRFGYQVPVVMRPARSLTKLAKSNPFLIAGHEPKGLYLMFLATLPSPESLDALDAQRGRPDQFAVRGDHVYLYYPNGSARSKLTTAYFDKTLRTTSTVRNWNTLTKLVELAD
jgi:uncharacterized protein (DUF1697 family)